MISATQAANIARVWSPGLTRGVEPPADWPAKTWFGIFVDTATDSPRDVRIRVAACLLANRVEREAPDYMIATALWYLDCAEHAPEPQQQAAPAPMVQNAPLSASMSPALLLAIRTSCAIFVGAMVINFSTKGDATAGASNGARNMRAEIVYAPAKPARPGPAYHIGR